MTRTRLVWVSLLAVAAMIVAACGDDDETASEQPGNSDEDVSEVTDIEGGSSAASDVMIAVAEAPQRTVSPFVARGGAVDEGIVCAAGDTEPVSIVDETGRAPPWDSPPENLVMDWQFTCDDGSGQFSLQLSLPADEGTPEIGEVMGEGQQTWEVLSGTDGYESLDGEGTRTWQMVELGVLIEAVWEGTVSR